MLASRLVSLSITLQQRPDLIAAVAAQLAELADCVRHLENSPVPPSLTGQFPADAGVIRLDAHRKQRA
jgi:hypothetical protein